MGNSVCQLYRIEQVVCPPTLRSNVFTTAAGGQCQPGTALLSWGSGELGQTGHGFPGAIRTGEAHLRQFAQGLVGKVKLLACGSSHSIVATGQQKKDPRGEAESSLNFPSLSTAV
ncbi:hypothetical protein NHX12_029331 [Muraenolepis orangiensis]|uniref:Uncharacterized protein n=1 Tax=Muraenolepis orangiensis TaxID=630683 RepID=A0A9Q0EF61_9TELE|nr:hypothetical protein NHX12_029331 [Muraenolepis orangiensis]